MSKVVPTSSIFNEEGVELALCAREEEEGAFFIFGSIYLGHCFYFLHTDMNYPTKVIIKEHKLSSYPAM